MKQRKEPKSLIFKENSCRLLKIHSIGYNDFSKNDTSVFLTTNVWHALYYVCGGRGSFSIRGETHELQTGSLFFVSPNEPVRYCNEEAEPIRYYWISFYADFAEEIWNILGFSDERPVHAAKSPQKIEWIFQSLLESPSANAEFYFHTLSSLMQILSAEFSRTASRPSEERHEAFVQNVRQIIELNCTNPDFHVEAVAKMLYVSHAHMSRIFRERTGITPVSYLVEMRLNHAARLLRERDDSVKNLCAASGFVDEWHFMKSFKKKFGMTVNEYKAIEKENRKMEE